MRTAHDGEPRQRALRAEYPRQQRFVPLARGIVVTVTGRGGEIALRQSFGFKSVQYLVVRALLRGILQRRNARVGSNGGLADASADCETIAEFGNHYPFDSLRSLRTWRS